MSKLDVGFCKSETFKIVSLSKNHMEIKILEQNKNKLKVEIMGGDHTISNAISNELWQNSNVRVSGYNIEHSLVSNPILIVETNDNETPKKALFNAISSIIKRNKEILSDFNKALK